MSTDEHDDTHAPIPYALALEVRHPAMPDPSRLDALALETGPRGAVIATPDGDVYRGARSPVRIDRKRDRADIAKATAARRASDADETARGEA